MVAHSALTGAEVHEPKGADTASANSVYVADGVGSGVWQLIQAAQIDTSSVKNVNKLVLYNHFTDVSAPDTVYGIVPFNATLVAVYTVLYNAITGADSLLTIKDHNGNTAGTITVSFSGSAAGDIDSVAPITNNTFLAGQKYSVTTDGASSTTARLSIALVFNLT